MVKFLMKRFYLDWVPGRGEEPSYYHLTETHYSRENPRELECESLEKLLAGEELEAGTIEVIDGAVYYWPIGSVEREVARRVARFSPPTFVWTVEQLSHANEQSSLDQAITTSNSSTTPARLDDRGAFDIKRSSGSLGWLPLSLLE